MRTGARSCVALLSCLAACSPIVGKVDQPPGESVTVEAEAGSGQQMTIWLQAFGAEQRREYSISERFCSEVTCGGRVTLLPKPYETRYWVSGSGKSYRIEVRHRGSQKICRLEDGFDAYPERAGAVICEPY